MGEYIYKQCTTKGLISKIYKQVIQLNKTNKQTKYPMEKNGQKTYIDIFPKKTYR